LLARARATLLLDSFVVPDPSVYDLQQQRARAVESGAPAWP
jgi:hypothetical protein